MNSVTQLASQVDKAARELREQKSKLINEREPLLLERHALLEALVPVDDIEALALDQIDRAAAQFEHGAKTAGALHGFLYPPRLTPGPWPAMRLRDFQAIRDTGSLGGAGFAPLGSLFAGGNKGADFGALCFFMGDLLKEGLSKLWRTNAPGYSGGDADRVGDALAESEEKLRTLDARLDDIRQECIEIDKQLAALGKNAPAVDLIIPDDRHADRDSQILSRQDTSTWNSSAVCLKYGVSADYAEYLKRKLPSGPNRKGGPLFIR